MRPKKERLLGGGARERDQHVRDVLPLVLVGHVRRPQTARARKRFEERRYVITQFAIGDPGIAQDMAREHVEIKMG